MSASGLWLVATGSYLPSVRHAAQSSGDPSPVPDEPERAGRVTVAGDLSAPDMALHAARRALSAAGASVRDLTLLLYASVWHQGPDGWMPHAYLQRHLRAEHALAVELRGGCTGIFTAIDLAAGQLAAGGPGDLAMVVSAENFGTKLVDRWCMGPFQGAVGDGASALLLSRRSGFARVLSSVTDTLAALEEAHRGAEPLFPPSATEGRYMDFGMRAGEFQERASRDGRWLRLMMQHRDRVVGVVDQALAEADVTRADVAAVLLHAMPHDTAAAYLDAVGFAFDDTCWRYGNGIGHVGASDHVLGLQKLVADRQVRPGDRVLLTGFSPGITYKAMVVEIAEGSGAETVIA